MAHLSGQDIRAITEAGVPLLLGGLVADWPLVQAGKRSTADAIQQLKGFHNGQPIVCYRAPPGARGRFFYDDDLTGFNFTATREPLAPVLDRLEAGDADGAIYIGSTDLAHYFPGLAQANPLDVEPLGAAGQPVLGSVWIGNKTTAATHFDISNNIACCVAGRRRFTLFPPHQLANLYPGPLEPTPAGQPVSMVDPANPDLARFPRFAEAMQHAIVADMAPGDVLIYPALWWHQVEALAPFNILVNYWWNPVPAHFDTPMTTLLHAMLSLRDRPQSEKLAWRQMFDHYIFGDPELPRAHLPAHARGELAPMTDMVLARRLRARLIKKLNR